ncbi:MAG: hypothetical protein JWN44_5711 [Myxococcales bacterium]|nr:hypothetical protein [Myxococcales bacterium]
MLPRELIKKIRRIEIVTARQAQNQLAGAYHSVFKGLGMAFSEVRQYQPGDDVRMIDWNVTARMREAYVKLFVEEREMTVMLLVDASASGAFGSREQAKREVAAEIAALLAFSAIKNNDRIGLIIFTDRVEKFVPPKKGKKHVLALITEILTFQPASKRTDLRCGLEFLGKVARRRSVAFLVSDFIVSGGTQAYEKAMRIAKRKHDLVPVTITDPMEEELPDVGYVYFEDVETGEVVTFDTGGPGRARFAAMVKRMRDERDQLFRKHAMDFVNVRTDRPYVAALVAFFRARERRMRH